MKHQQEHTDHEMMKIEVNLDDIPGEWLGYVMELLLEEGANDVFYIPIYMKKNRPGTQLQVLCSKDRLKQVTAVIFKETTTLGLRYYPLSVHRLGRNFVQIETPWGTVPVKQGIMNGEVIQQAPEYEVCKELAIKHDIPLKIIFQEVWKQL
ncbi:nickel pincer cofactor biosynthesis protein LarC2 [Bacillus massiliglaciei]|uniref:nickel insertion protein n=1 Tax=Bacillus massiliglaciei TaxID=1816693 RepID=UPI000B043D1E|nr:nickel insertion protein [Bacillus massiliglaciei]